MYCTWQSPQGQILLMQPEFLPDLTPILDHPTGKLPSMFYTISKAQWTTRSPISLLIHLSHSSLMQTMEAILTMASPLEVMWSRLGLEQCLGDQSVNLWSPYPPLKQSTSQQLRQARRSCGCANSWGSWDMMFLDLPCFGWTISPQLQKEPAFCIQLLQAWMRSLEMHFPTVFGTWIMILNTMSSWTREWLMYIMVHAWSPHLCFDHHGSPCFWWILCRSPCIDHYWPFCSNIFCISQFLRIKNVHKLSESMMASGNVVHLGPSWCPLLRLVSIKDAIQCVPCSKFGHCPWRRLVGGGITVTDIHGHLRSSFLWYW